MLTMIICFILVKWLHSHLRSESYSYLPKLYFSDTLCSTISLIIPIDQIGCLQIDAWAHKFSFRMCNPLGNDNIFVQDLKYCKYELFSYTPISPWYINTQANINITQSKLSVRSMIKKAAWKCLRLLQVSSKAVIRSYMVWQTWNGNVK